MSFPGLSAQQPDQQQPDQPLFGQPAVNPQILKLQQALAQQMMQGGGQEQPISSPYQLAAHITSPLIGMLMQRHLAKQQDALQADMAKQLPDILKSADPISAMAASQNPLIREMMSQALPAYLRSGFDTRAAVQKETQLGPIKNKNALDLMTQSEPLEVQKAADVAKATSAADVAKALAIAKGTLPFELAKTRAGQVATFADLAEKKREFDLNQGGAAGIGPLGTNPASLYGSPPK